MGNFGFGEILIIVFIVLIIFGPSKLPEVGKALGRAIGDFKKGLRGDPEDKEPKK
jgi:sec-independent protein translocase protein TatA